MSRTVLTSGTTLLAGWIHYLAFDLLTGVWETRDAASRGIPHWMDWHKELGWLTLRIMSIHHLDAFRLLGELAPEDRETAPNFRPGNAFRI